MTGLEIITLGAEGVKKSPEALQAYKTQFFDLFGKTPDCPACGTSLGLNDWKAFNAVVEGAEVADVKKSILGFSQSDLDKTFVAKPSHKMIRYNEFRDGRWFVNRSYPDTMTEEFAIGLLESAENAAQFKELSKIFSILPAKFRDGAIEAEIDELLNEEIIEDEEIDEILNEEIIIADEVIEEEPTVEAVTEYEEIIEEKAAEEVEETEEEKAARIKEEKNAARRARDKAARDAKKAAETQQ